MDRIFTIIDGIPINGCIVSEKVENFSIDARDRVTSQGFYNAGGTLQSQVAMAPDANGNVLTVTEGASVITRTFDQQDRVKSYVNAAGETIGYRYDADGNLKVLTYPDGKTVTYGYDENDRLTSVTDWAGRLTLFTWDNAGRLMQVNRANGTKRVMSYDAADRLTRAEERLGNGRLVTVQQYGFDAGSRLTNKFTSAGLLRKSSAFVIRGNGVFSFPSSIHGEGESE